MPAARLRSAAQAMDRLGDGETDEDRPGDETRLGRHAPYGERTTLVESAPHRDGEAGRAQQEAAGDGRHQ